ncbi:MAG: DUF445 family protein [Vallitaleaceae bacterium]|nr:DUF445 family protein [Vallitaleaceae bacterium]
MDLSWILKPLMGGVIGYTTNYLAIKMLFRPYKAKYIGKFRIPFTPGLIPKERNRIASSLGETVGKRLLTEEVILNELTNERIIHSLKEYVVNEVIGDRIQLQKLISEWFSESELRELLESLSKSLIEEISSSESIPILLDSGVKKMLQYDMTIEEIITTEAKEKIRSILAGKGKDVSFAIVHYLQKEEIQTRIREMLSKLIAEKLGFAAMFIQADSILKMINEHLNDYLSKEENHEKVAKLLLGIVDELGNKKISQFMSEQEYEELTKSLATLLYTRIQEAIRTPEMLGVITQLLHRLLSKEILVHRDWKDKIERAIETLYLKFVRDHLPLFLQEFNVSNIVEGEINAFSVEEVENLIFQIVDKELNAITWLGAFLGVIMACILLLVG